MAACLISLWLVGWPRSRMAAGCLHDCMPQHVAFVSELACVSALLPPPMPPPQGRRTIPLLRFQKVFYIPINDLKKNLRFLVITVLHHPLRASGLCPCLISCMLSAFLSANCRNKYSLPSPSYMPRQASYPLARNPICLSHSHR